MMKCIKTKDDLSHLEDEAIKESISNHILTLEQQYDEPYQATLHGWFIICEDESDLSEPLANMTFSLSDKLHLSEVEYVEKKQNWYEVYVLLNDNEGILIYVPHAILLNHSLTAIKDYLQIMKIHIR